MTLRGQSSKRMYIDNPWEEVEKYIRWVAADELLDEGYPPVKASKAETEWAEKTARKIASRTMNFLDGGEYEADADGLRKFDGADPSSPNDAAGDAAATGVGPTTSSHAAPKGER